MWVINLQSHQCEVIEIFPLRKLFTFLTDGVVMYTFCKVDTVGTRFNYNIKDETLLKLNTDFYHCLQEK